MSRVITRRATRRSRGAFSALTVAALVAGLGALGAPAATAVAEAPVAVEPSVSEQPSEAPQVPEVPEVPDVAETPEAPEATEDVQAPETAQGAGGADTAPLAAPGAPEPQIKTFFNYLISESTTIIAYPGTWVPFSLVLENRSTATGNLTAISASNRLPAELSYDPAFDGATWKATLYRLDGQGSDVTDDLQFTIDDSGPERVLRWVAPADWELQPGERIAIKVPLMLADGTAAGTQVRNTARIVGSGVPGSTPASACADESATSSECSAFATVTAIPGERVRAESYLDASIGGAAMMNQTACDVTSFEGLGNGTWVRNPCIVNAAASTTLTYRLKLINSGNRGLGELRFVDKLPMQNDKGTVVNSARGSLWGPNFVPGSARLLTGAEAEALGARGDGLLNGGNFRYTSATSGSGNTPCMLSPDAYGGADTLECVSAGAEWSTTDSTSTRAFGADIVFPEGQLQGGEFVIVEFQAQVPEERPTAATNAPFVSWNSLALTGRSSAQTYWLPAAESFSSGARWETTSMSLTLDLADGPATDWHFTADEYTATVSCTVPGWDAATPLVREVTLPGVSSASETVTTTVADLPVDSLCTVTDVRYDPAPATAPGQYGSAAATPAPTGFAYTALPADAITLALDPADNTIGITNSFAEATVELGVDLTGAGAIHLPNDVRFDVALSCSFAGETRDMGSFALAPGERELVEGLPVGANCTVTETAHFDATTVTANIDGEAAEVSAARSVELTTLEAGEHTAYFSNDFAAGGALTILKTVDAPDASTAIGDVSFGVSCTLGGYEIALDDQASLTLSFAPGEREASGSLTGLPAGAECTVTELEAGGATITAPDRTVTVLEGTEVVVEMHNVVSPAALQLDKRVTGAGATESRVPAAFDIRASCTRELTIEGELRTVTDHDALTRVVPGEPALIENLPEGSRCAVSEPDTAGAELTTVELTTEGLIDEEPAEDAVLVELRGPEAAGDAQVTALLVTNEYAKSDVPDPQGPDTEPTPKAPLAKGPDTGLAITGASGVQLGFVAGASVLLVLLGGAVWIALARREARFEA